MEIGVAHKHYARKTGKQQYEQRPKNVCERNVSFAKIMAKSKIHSFCENVQNAKCVMIVDIRLSLFHSLSLIFFLVLRCESIPG